MENSNLNDTAPRSRKRLGALVAGTAFLGAAVIYADVDVRFASTFDAVNQQSDGSGMDSSFTFQLGVFDGGFTPSSSNTDMWLDNWTPVPNAGSGGDSTAPYTQTALPFATRTGESNLFSGTARLDGNPPGFTSTDQAFIWGYDDRGEGGGGGVGEWILLTNSNWLFPTDTGGVQFGSDFQVSDAGTTAILGSVNPAFDSVDDAPHMVSSNVLLPVPEPSVGLLLLGGAGAMLARRRR